MNFKIIISLLTIFLVLYRKLSKEQTVFFNSDMILPKDAFQNHVTTRAWNLHKTLNSVLTEADSVALL